MSPEIVEFLALALLYLTRVSAGGSCSAAKLCCEGRDSGCVIQKAAPNAIIESPQDKPCYCDHACLKLNDCCNDFRDTCRVVDCAVSEWEDWSPCGKRCGAGVQTRTRVIAKQTENGGKHCPQLEQSRSCHSYAGCRHNTRVFHLKDVALLTMASLENLESASLENLESASSNDVSKMGYCATFTIVRTSRACGKDFPTLTEGSEICVMCRGDTSTTRCPDNGHPSRFDGIGRWKMMTPTSARCHGKWIGGTSSKSQCDSASVCRDVGSRLVFV